MAVGYGCELELHKLAWDLQAALCSLHSVTLGQATEVSALAWRGEDHLLAFGTSLMMWESTLPALGSHAVWMCTFAQSLPSPVRSVRSSPDGKFFAALGTDGSVRIYQLTIAMETLPLRSELGRLLGRSYSQGLDFFGPVPPLLHHFKVPFPAGIEITGISWRMYNGRAQSSPSSADSSVPCNSLLLATARGPCFILAEDRNSKSAYGSLFSLHQCYYPSEKVGDLTDDSALPYGPDQLAWWLEDMEIEGVTGRRSMLVGEGSSALIAYNNDQRELQVIRLSNVDMASGTMVSLDPLVNVSVGWPKNPEIASAAVLLLGEVAIRYDLTSRLLHTLVLKAAAGEQGEVTGDFSYETVKASRPLYSQNAQKVHVSGSLIAIQDGEGDHYTILQHDPPSLQAALAAGSISSLYSHHHWPNVFFVIGKADRQASLISGEPPQLVVLKDAEGRELGSLGSIIGVVSSSMDVPDKPVTIIGLSHGNEHLMLLKVDLSSGLYQRGDHLPLLSPGKLANVAAFGSSMGLFVIEEGEGQLAVMFISPSSDDSFEVVTNVTTVPLMHVRKSSMCSDYGDYAYVNEDRVLVTISLSPTSDKLVSVQEADVLMEFPLYIGFAPDRTLHIILSDALLTYCVTLSESGQECWTRAASSPWPPYMPQAIGAELESTLSLAVMDELRVLLLAVDGMIFKLAECYRDIERMRNDLQTIPDTILAYRSINYAATDQFSILDVPAEADGQQQQGLSLVRRDSLKYPHPRTRLPRADGLGGSISNDAFSFFDEVEFFAESDDEDTEFCLNQATAITRTTSAKASGAEMDRLEGGRTITPRPSLNTSCVGRIRMATLEAARGLQGDQMRAVDSAGLKYLYFTRLSWSLGASVSASSGFEYLAAYFSDAQEFLIEATRELLELSASASTSSAPMTWARLGPTLIGVWIKNEQRLKEILEEVARADFLASSSSTPQGSANTDPAMSAILYLIMGRRNLLKTLWKNRQDTEGSKMVCFLDKNFEDESIRLIAVKNAFAALSKQRLKLSLFFFLLARRLEDALQVCFERLHDFHLGYLIGRFMCDATQYEYMIARYVRGNKRIPICLRAMMKKPMYRDKEYLDLVREETDFAMDKAGLCLPLAIVSLRGAGTRKLPGDLLCACVEQLCLSGCYDLAAKLAFSDGGWDDNETTQGHHLLMLRNLTTTWASRWCNSDSEK